MSVQGKSLFIAGTIAVAIAIPAYAQGLKQVGTIAIPGEPITQLGVMTIDQSSGLGYLAEKDNKAVDVFDTKTNKFVSRITGFVGQTKNGDDSGPNGVIVVNDGAELWVSDGDSTIKIVDLKSGQISATLATGGKVRANAMAYDPKDKIVIVANSNDEPPFLSLISTEPGNKILAKIPVAESGENLERSSFHAASGMFYTVIPVLRADPTKGILAQTDAKNGKLVKLHALDGCHPHSLQVVSDSTIFLGCSSAHGANAKPGGDLAVFDIATGTITARGAGLGGNGSSDLNPKLGQYYHATTAATLMVVDMKTAKPIQKISTSQGARSIAASQANNRVYLATIAKGGPCGGCIQVYAPE
jgi:DNA-binding beta-propeller fold protein YncE